ncbi:MAG: YqjK-like family protein [Candidatus Accumulibacter sp.]|jgi:hypothetical protein|nr:YqjK-like family protein [Accumulibacter sp.]
MATLSEIHLRRGRLQERIAVQRASLAGAAQPIRRALGATDSAVAGVRAGVAYLKQRPWAVGALATALIVLRGKRIFRVVRRGFIVWRTWVSLRNTLREILAF